MKRPNIVLIMTDQQRADLRKGQGYSVDTMPFLDALGEKGVDFARAYTSLPACVPARVSLYTGRFPSAHHVKSNLNSTDAFFSEDLIDVLRRVGYQVGACGKNHSHRNKEDFDFASFFGALGSRDRDRTRAEKEFDAHLKRRGHETAMEPTPFPVELQICHRIVSQSLEWVESCQEDPFFLWISFPEPHNPYQVPEPYFSMFPDEDLPPLRAEADALSRKSYKYQYMRQRWQQFVPDIDACIRRTRKNYHGMLRLLDDELRRFVSGLTALGLAENTLLIFVSDHGDFVGEYGLMRKGPELPEVLVRIPMMFSGPGVVPKRDWDSHVSIVDIFPTICEVIGTQIPAGVQGRSLWPLLTGADYPKAEFDSVYAEHGIGGGYYTDDDPEDVVTAASLESGFPPVQELNSRTQAGFLRMLRKGDWKLLYDMEGNGQLYNLATDPAEVDDLFGQEKVAQIQAELIEELLLWTIQMQDSLPYPRDRLMVLPHEHNYRLGREGDKHHE